MSKMQPPPPRPKGERKLKSRLLSAGGWTIGAIMGERLLRLGSNLVMTRLLVPEAFGLMAMVMTVQMMVNMIADIGIRQSIVRAENGEDAHFLRVAWTVQIVRSGIVAGVVALLAGGFALFGASLGADTVYADPQLPALILVSTLAIMMRGAESVALHLAARKLNLSRLALIEVSEPLITIPAMILFAQIEASVWALLFGMLVGSGARLGLSHLIFPRPRMRLAWDKVIAAELWTFGRFLIGASLAGFVARNGDRLILGGLLDKTAFGQYAIAALWIQTGVMVLQKLNDRVIYAAISEAQRKAPQTVATLFGRLRRSFDALCLLAFLVAFFAGAPLIGVLYTAEYQAVGLMVTLLSVRLLAERYLPLGAFMLSMRDSRTVMNVAALSGAWMVVAPLAAYRVFGLEATLISVALMPLTGAPLLLRRAAVHMKRSVAPFDIAALAGIIAVSAAAYLWPR
jgi:O-antigen/teichoic acid export membrane protein